MRAGAAAAGRVGAGLRGFTFDTGALIAYERGSGVVNALIRQAGETSGAVVHIPAGVVAQAFRDGRRQARLMRLFKLPQAQIVALDPPMAFVVGLLLGRRAGDDVVDASVVVCARRYGQGVLTSDPDDLRRLDPDLPLEIV